MTQHDFDNFLKLVTAAAHMAAPVIAKLPGALTQPTSADDTPADMQVLNAIVFREVRTMAGFLAASSTPQNYATYWPPLDVTGGGDNGSGSGAINPDALLAAFQTLMAGPQGPNLINMVKTVMMGGHVNLPPVAAPVPPTPPAAPSAPV